MVYIIIIIDLFGGVYECVARHLCLEWGLHDYQCECACNLHVSVM